MMHFVLIVGCSFSLLFLFGGGFFFWRRSGVVVSALNC